jgi:predicted nucleic acid-binding protein
MSTVISNSSPLIGFSAIGRLDLIQRTFGHVLIPEAVEREVNTPAKSLATPTRSWEPIRADWLGVVCVKENRDLAILRESLGAGETEAIMLAIERGLPILLDDLPARKTAVRLKLRPIGSLGILAKCKYAGVIREAKPLVRNLQDAGIFYAKDLIEGFLHKIGEI